MSFPDVSLLNAPFFSLLCRIIPLFLPSNFFRILQRLIDFTKGTFLILLGTPLPRFFLTAFAPPPLFKMDFSPPNFAAPSCGLQRMCFLFPGFSRFPYFWKSMLSFAFGFLSTALVHRESPSPLTITVVPQHSSCSLPLFMFFLTLRNLCIPHQS